MKKILNVLPFILLIAVVIKSFIIQPTVSESVILTALSALCAYRFYFMERETPDYVKMFQQKIESVTNDYNTKIINLSVETKEIKDNYTKIVLPMANKPKQKFEF